MIPVEIAQFYSEKRARKRKHQRTRQGRALAQKRVRENIRKATFGNRSKIIKLLADEFRGDFSLRGQELVVCVPEVFSIIEDPKNAIFHIQRFAKIVRQHKVKFIKIDQSKLRKYDLAANALLDLVAVEISMEWRQKGVKARFSGKYPTDPHVQRFVRSLGIVKHLKIKKEIVNDDEAQNLRVFDKRNRHYTSVIDPHSIDFKSRTSQQFADHVNSCLRDNGRVLTPRARQKLCDYIGEILGNAEDHPKFVDWTIQGYLDNSLEIPICEIAIFNFGLSIADTLKELPSEHYTRKQIVDKYLQLHYGQRYFGPDWRQSDLLTLVALQGHVSSKNFTESDTRGQGTIDLIDFFQKVHAECSPESTVKPKMAIVSGGTYILFDGTYKMREGENGGKVIAFNEQNSLYLKPDAHYVQSLGSVKFPGTIISIRFPLSVSSTTELAEE